jgi:hypothetical protein
LGAEAHADGAGISRIIPRPSAIPAWITRNAEEKDGRKWHEKLTYIIS